MGGTLNSLEMLYAYPDGVGIHCKHHDRLFSPRGLLLLAVLYATPSL